MIHINTLEAETAVEITVMPVAEFGGRVVTVDNDRVVEVMLSDELTVALWEWQARDLVMALQEALPPEDDGDVRWEAVEN